MNTDPALLREAARDKSIRPTLEALLIRVRKEAERAELCAAECERQAKEARDSAAFTRAREGEIMAALSEIAL